MQCMKIRCIYAKIFLTYNFTMKIYDRYVASMGRKNFRSNEKWQNEILEFVSIPIPLSGNALCDSHSS